jgi:hypothetical protein
MRWLKRDIWKAGIAIAGLLLFLVLMVWAPVSANAYEGATRLATSETVQSTPTVDATVTALTKEQLEQEVQQLKNENATDLLGWLRMNAGILLELPLNSWSRETFEVYYFRKRVNKDEESAKDLYR